MKNYFTIIVLCIFNINLFGQSVTLTKEKDRDEIKFIGTIKMSDGKDYDKSIKCDFVFNSDTRDGGYGKITNITNDVIKMKVTCIDCDDIKERILIVVVKPRTFSRIIFSPANPNNKANYRTIKCELIR